MKSILLEVVLISTLVLSPGQSAVATTTPGVPASKHIVVWTLENASYKNIIGNSQMPYLNGLASQNALATEYYADQHSSLPALFWIVAGAPVEPNNDTTSCAHSNNNVVRQVLASGYSWRAYAEGLGPDVSSWANFKPQPGYQGLYGGLENTYYRRHNPLVDFTDTCPCDQEGIAV